MKIVTLGEIMLRLTPSGYDRFVQTASFEAHYGGAEANVAAALANWGEDALFVSKVPDHEIGQAAVDALRAVGVDTRGVLRGGERLGIYYAERGADRRASKVIYDRANSALPRGRVRLGQNICRGRLVSHHGHNARAREKRGRGGAFRLQSGEGAGSDRILRRKLPQQTVG